MNPINSLGIKVSALTGVVLVLLAVTYWGGQYAWQSLKGGADEAAPQEVAIAPERTDSDGDQLPDQYESLYRTDKNNPDSDGDGTNDLDEITNGRDPAVAGVLDEVKPITGPGVTDQSTFTGKYLSQLPEETDRDQILNQERLEAFVNLNKGLLVPSIAPTAIKTTTDSGKEAIQAYLQNIASSHNKELFAVTNSDIEVALTARLRNQPQPLDDIEGKLEKNAVALQAVATPAETVALHQKLVGASQALHENVKLLQNTPQDFVGGLIASKNIEALGTVFQEIAQEIAALEQKYELE